MTTLAAGSRLGQYQIRAPIGAGGMGEVYRAHDAKLEREVAIKILPPALAGDPSALARFEREAKAVAALSHPHILAIHDFGREAAIVYAVMELLEGQTLRERLADGALPVRKALDIALQIAQGLAAAHEKGIVHRDLKPDNVFLTTAGRVKILDFGLAKAIQASPNTGETVAATREASTPGMVVGTIGYMSPEQVTGAPVDQRTDIFAFGALVYEMLDRAFRVRSREQRRNDCRDPARRRPGRSRSGGSSATARAHPAPLPGEEVRRALSLRARCRHRPRSPARPLVDDIRDDRRSRARRRRAGRDWPLSPPPPSRCSPSWLWPGCSGPAGRRARPPRIAASASSTSRRSGSSSTAPRGRSSRRTARRSPSSPATACGSRS